MNREALIPGDTKEYRVLFTNRALLNVETWTGKSIVAIVAGFVNGRSGVAEIARLLQAGMEESRREAKEGGNSVTLDDALEALDDIGTINALNLLQDAVGGVLNYRSEDKEETSDADPN